MLNNTLEKITYNRIKNFKSMLVDEILGRHYYGNEIPIINNTINHTSFLEGILGYFSENELKEKELKTELQKIKKKIPFPIEILRKKKYNKEDLKKLDIYFSGPINSVIETIFKNIDENFLDKLLIENKKSFGRGNYLNIMKDSLLTPVKYALVIGASLEIVNYVSEGNLVPFLFLGTALGIAGIIGVVPAGIFISYSIIKHTLKDYIKPKHRVHSALSKVKTLFSKKVPN